MNISYICNDHFLNENTLSRWPCFVKIYDLLYKGYELFRKSIINSLKSEINLSEHLD